MRTKRLGSCVRLSLAVLAMTSAVPAKAGEAVTAPLLGRQVEVSVDSGLVENSRARETIVFTTTLRVEGARWLRLKFDDVLLAGDPAGGTGSYLVLTALEDGASQTLNAIHLGEWRNQSAYFNGDAVIIDLIACPGTGPNRLTMTEVTAGVDDVGPRSICGPTDDRELSDDPRVARSVPVGCTVWMIDDPNHCFLTAGHCASGGSMEVVWFNMPLSDPDGTPNPPPPEDQYPIDPVSIQYNNGGVGNDWCYFGCFANPDTGLTPVQAQGDFFVLVPPPDVAGQSIRITGHGTVSSPVSPTWNAVQKTHAGPYFDYSGTTVQYQTDTTGGNSGSPVINDDTGEAIGIHTHGGCSTWGGNSGTASIHSGLQAALADPKGVCIPKTLLFEYPEGLPELIDPAGGTTVRVEVKPNSGIVPQPGTGQLHYDLGAGFVAVPMEVVSDNVYDAVFPAADCGSTVRFFFSAESTEGGISYDPLVAPKQYYSALVGTSLVVYADYDFETDPGWTVENVDLTDGAWDRGVPVNNDRGDPPADYDGSGQCFLTDNDAFDSNSDVDGGPTRLISQVIDLGDAVAPTLSYARWFYNDDQDIDRLDVEVSSDGGDTWTLIESAAHAEGWVQQTINLVDYTALTSTVRFRFSATDNPNDSVTEAAIDAFRIFELECDEGGVTVFPDDLEIVRGQLLSGGLADLYQSDDSALVVQLGFVLAATEPPVWLVVEGTADTAAPAKLKFALEARATSVGLTQRIELYNFVTESYEEMDAGPASTTDSTIEVSVADDPARFIDPLTRKMRAQLTWKAAGPVTLYPWQVAADRSVWTITP